MCKEDDEMTEPTASEFIDGMDATFDDDSDTFRDELQKMNDLIADREEDKEKPLD